jgi:hypothetical protein
MRPVTKAFRRAVKRALPPHLNDLESREKLAQALERLLWEIRQPNVKTVEFVINRDQDITEGLGLLGRFRTLHPTRRHVLLAVTISLHPPQPDECVALTEKEEAA